ncbi:glycosyltransferase family 4 protein [Vibrio sp. LaRot3]|uniref:glycosyltransferase family 4 protein n=1 Tax=Vibrio sp. LaRot3 TaxID=2998829 RepID=UPI0022CE1EFC|nr:glycosyltransferase family 4 protein [Vibrio sp. LaRot3]MDA0149384.1 glycosyltransferase family 4 protein [Vibrio sp. LaRot3]
MRILHTESSCGWGGQEIRILTESQGLIELGHSVEILCAENSKIYEEALKRKIPAFKTNINKKSLAAYQAMSNHLRTNEYDVINTHSSTDSWLVSLFYAFKRNRPRIVRTRHLSTKVHNNLASKWLYQKGSDFIVTTGEKVKEQLHKENGVSLNKMQSVVTGIDDSLFYPYNDKTSTKESLGIPENKFIIGIVATIRSWKGHFFLLEALAKINNPNLHLIVVGDGPNRQLTEDKVEQLNLTNSVSFVGNQDNVPDWLNCMDLFVLPSYGNEGVPQGLMQAMLCKVPVISTPVGSVEEIVIHQKTGLIVPTKQSDILKQAIESLVSNQRLRCEYKENAFKLAKEKCTKSVMCQNMLTIFSK